MLGLLWLIVLVLLALWIIGFVIHWALTLVWILFVIAIIVLLFGLVVGPRRGRWY